MRTLLFFSLLTFFCTEANSKSFNLETPPVDCPANEMIDCFSDIMPGTPVSNLPCPVESTVTSEPILVSGSAECSGSVYEITYTVTDDCSNTGSCTQTFTLNTVTPTIDCPADETVSCFSDIMEGTPFVTNDCGVGGEVVVTGPTLVSGDDLCDGAMYEISYSFNDDCGGVADCVQTFTLAVSPPTISCPADETVNCLEDFEAGTPTITTACGLGSTFASVGELVSGTDLCAGAIYEVTYTVTDDCGATATCIQLLTLDAGPPAIVCPADETVSCFEDIIEGTATATAQCDGVSATISTSSPTLVSGTDFCDGAVYEITYTATDDCGLSSECVQTFTLDSAAPTITCPAAVTVSCFEDIVETCNFTLLKTDAFGDGWNGAMMNVIIDGEAETFMFETNTDFESDLIEAPVGSLVEFEWLDLGTFSGEVGFDVLDSGGNTIFSTGPGGQSLDVVFSFNQYCPGNPMGMTTSCGFRSSFTVSEPDLVSGTDFCDGAVYELTYTITDDCGGTGQCVQTVTLAVDPPSIVCPADVTVACFEDIAGTCPFTLEAIDSFGDGWNDASLDVIVDGSVVSSVTLESGSLELFDFEADYGASVEFVWTDLGGFPSELGINVLNSKGINIFSAAGNPVLGDAFNFIQDCGNGLPENTTSCDIGNPMPITMTGPTLASGTDLCDEATYEVTFTVTDNCGTTASCIQTFTLDVLPPTIECPEDMTVDCFDDILVGTPVVDSSCGDLSTTVTTVGPTLVIGTDLCDEAEYEIVYTVADACGVESSCTQTFTLDVGVPTIDCPADMTVVCFDEVVAGTPVTTTSCDQGGVLSDSGPVLVSGVDLCDGAIYEITYDYTDDCGVTVSCIQTFTLDIGAPVIFCPGDETVSCASDIAAGTPTFLTQCGLGSSLSASAPILASGDDGCNGAIYEITHTVIDDCGQTASCVQTFTLDVGGPTITCPADETVNCFEDIAASVPSVTSECGQGVVLSTSEPILVSGTDLCDDAVYEITYTVEDDCGLSASCIQTFTLDVAAPTITCPADETVNCVDDIVAANITATLSCSFGSVLTEGSQLPTSECSDCVTASAPVLVSGSDGCDGAVYEITYTATDVCGASSSCTQTFTLDVGGPVISCPGDELVNCVDDIIEGTPIVTTDCGQGYEVTTTGPTLISGSAGCDDAVYEITYTATDDCGLSDECTQTFTLSVGGPSITCPADETVSCIADIMEGDPTVTTECGLSYTVTTVGPTLFEPPTFTGSTSQRSALENNCDGDVYQIEYTVTDDCGGSDVCVQFFTIEVDGPTIECPVDETVSCLEDVLPAINGMSPWMPTVTTSCDDLGSTVTSTGEHVAGTFACDGSQYEITYTATDDCGQMATCIQTITLDVGGPTITCPADETVTCFDDIIAGTAEITTECDLGSTITTEGPTLASGTDLCDGATYTITYTVTDDCGASAACMQTFTLLGPPTIVCPADETVSCFDDILVGTPTTTTECSRGSVVTTEGPTLVSGDDLCGGAIYEITYTVTDDCGTIASCTQNFTLDVPGPTIVCPSDATVTCVDDIVIVNLSASVACNLGSQNIISYLEDQACSTAFIDISTTGTALIPPLSDDSEVGITTANNYSFYGIQTNEFTVGTNGGIIPGTLFGNISSSNSTFPQSTPLIAPFWDDLDTDFGNIYWEEVGTLLIVQWYEIPHFDGAGDTDGVNFQIQIDAGTGVITFVYGDLVFASDSSTDNDFGGSATVGINAGTDFGGDFVLSSSNDDALLMATSCVSYTPEVIDVIPSSECFDCVTASTPVLVSGDDGCNGAVYEVTYTATDVCGSTAECVQTVTLMSSAPMITCPADETVSCFSDIVVGTPITSTDCGSEGVVTTVGPTLATGDGQCSGSSYEITYTITDDCGMFTKCVQTFTIDALEMPTITCPADATVSCLDDVVAGDPLITTPCGLSGTVSSSGVLVSGTDNCDGAVYEITYSITDQCGGVAECVQTFTLEVDGPTIECPADETVSSVDDIIIGSPVVTTACGLESTLITDGPNLVIGDDPLQATGEIYEVVYTVIDECGNSAECTQSFYIDGCPPVLEVNFDPILAGTYQAANVVISSGTISQSTTTFKAGDLIELNAGFEVLIGEEFEAIIEGCDEEPE